MHEILTIQLGHRANHLATHFWNTQESYFTYDPSTPPSIVDHDIHFRPGVNAKGVETYTPRTLIYDLKGGFGGLRKWGGLYDQELSLSDGPEQTGQDSVWKGNVALQQDPQIEVSDYQRSLEQANHDPQNLTTDTVHYWSDYNRVFYHPRSIVPLNAYDLNSSIVPFEKYETGEELFRNIDRDDDILDRDFRLWAEECDQMQGIQVFAGDDDAWAGFATSYAERLRDEFGKTGIWVWGVGEDRGKGSRAKQALRAINSARMMAETYSHASMFVSTSMPSRPLPAYMQLEKESQWHISALISTALETVMLPSRLRDGGARRAYLDDMSAILNANGRQRIAQLQCSIDGPNISILTPKPHKSVDSRMRSSGNAMLTVEDDPEGDVSDLDLDFSTVAASQESRTRSSHHLFGSVRCSRGLIQGLSHDMDIDDDELSYDRKRRRLTGKSVIERYHIPLAYPLPDSFPAIYTNASESKVNVHASLSTSTQSAKAIQTLQKRTNVVANLDEREALFNSLGEIAEAYKEGWDSDGDYDSDD